MPGGTQREAAEDDPGPYCGRNGLKGRGNRADLREHHAETLTEADAHVARTVRRE